MAGWQIKQLGDLCEFQRGLTYAKTDEVPVSENIVLRANNVDLASNELDLSDLRFISDSVQVPADKKLRKGSLLICTASGSKSHLGKVAFVDDDYGYAFGGFMGQITPAAGVDGRYLFHVLTSPGYKDFIAALSDGANINNLKFNDLRQFPVSLPPLAEQRRIVTILDEAFEGIATAKANAEKNLQNARELFGRLSAAVLEQLAPISRTARLEEVAEPGCSLSYGIVQPGDEIAGGMPIVRPVDLNDGLVTLDSLKRIDPTLAKSYDRTRLKGDDILLCVRGTTGALALADRELAGANVTRGIVPIRFDTAQISQDFGYFLMRSEPVQAQIRAKTYGTALMQINIRDLRQLALPVPPKDEQEAAVARFDELKAATDKLVEIYQRKLATLDELKKSLLNQAFSSQLTASGADCSHPAVGGTMCI